MTELFPFVREYRTDVPAAAITATPTINCFEVEYTGVVTAAYIIPNANLTDADTHFRTLTLSNRKTDGSTGAVTIATLTTEEASGDWVASDRKDMTLSGTAANLVVTAGEVVAMIESITGNGIAHSGYTLVVEVTRS
jgi:hypothetical protein